MNETFRVYCKINDGDVVDYDLLKESAVSALKRKIAGNDNASAKVLNSISIFTFDNIRISAQIPETSSIEQPFIVSWKSIEGNNSVSVCTLDTKFLFRLFLLLMLLCYAFV